MEEKGEMVARDGVGHPLLVDGGDGLLDLGHPVVEYKGDGGGGQREGQRHGGQQEELRPLCAVPVRPAYQLYISSLGEPPRSCCD